MQKVNNNPYSNNKTLTTLNYLAYTAVHHAAIPFDLQKMILFSLPYTVFCFCYIFKIHINIKVVIATILLLSALCVCILQAADAVAAVLF